VTKPIRLSIPLGILALALVAPCVSYAQEAAPTAPSDAAALDSLVAQALASSPGTRAARDRVEAARAAVGPAGALPDPMLAVGITNLPVSDPGFSDFMTMKMVGIGQTLPYPGKLALRRRAATAEIGAADADLAAARLKVEAEVKQAYYELAFYDQALAILRRNEALLADFTKVTLARYGVGTGTQADVLRSRVETGRLAGEASRLVEERRAALARLNAALSRPSDTPVTRPAVPQRIARAAVAGSAAGIHFASAELGARASDSPLPSLADLQEEAVRSSPEIQHHEAMIAAQAARVELAGKAYLPDVDLSLQYGQRAGNTDMVSAMVSVPIPLHKRSKQDLEVKQAQATLSALQAEHHETANALRAKVAELYSGLEQDRSQLALYVKSILPQGRAALQSATAGFQVGRVDFLTLVDDQATLYNYETRYYRSLTSFAEKLAELDRTVGKEILP
jgi:outer membrane protein TolC